MRVLSRSVLALLLITLTLGPWPRSAFASPAVANGVVGDGTPGSCTYAELLTEINAAGNITFACGAAPHIIILTAFGGVQPPAGQATTLDGGGLITLSGANSDNRRLFDVVPTAVLTLTRLTLTNATTTNSGGGALRNRGRLVLDDVVLQNSSAQGFWGGGGIANDAGTLLIRNSLLRANYSAGGGALFNAVAATAIIESSTFLSNTVTDETYGGAISNSGVLTITASTFTGNAVTLSSYCPRTACVYGGGAIANLAGARLVISATTFTGNVATLAGGALVNLGYVSMADSTVSQNRAAWGGGVANMADDDLNLTRVRLTGNQADYGGGLYVEFGTAGLTDVTIDSNAAVLSGGGIHTWYDGQTALTRVTVSRNQATAGGGIVNYGFLTLMKATLTANWAEYGGGLYNASFASLTYVTISGNSDTVSSGGGILEYPDPSRTLLLEDVLLAGNLPQNCNAQPQSATFNLSTDATCFAAGNGNQVSTPLLLGPLANNGGLTLTQLPAPGSAAVDNGSCLPGIATDQRGLPRPAGVSCDIGAAERQANDFGWYLFLPLTVR